MKKIIACCLFISLFSFRSFSQLKDPLVVKEESGFSTLNWTVLKQIILSFPDLKPLTLNDSVDYIGQVYYKALNEAKGFERSAIKRVKSKNKWFYEAFFKITDTDTARVEREFISLYQTFKSTIAANSGKDFLMTAVATDSITKKHMNWLVQWTLFETKTLPPGLPKIRIALMLNGMEGFMDKKKRVYTIKIYITDEEVNFDFFTWDTPK